jgi:hypothetical protein
MSARWPGTPLNWGADDIGTPAAKLAMVVCLAITGLTHR